MPPPSVWKAVTSDAVIYLPGIMGSELVDADDDVVWGMSMKLLLKQAVFGDALDRLVPRDDDGITATGPIRVPLSLPGLTSIELEPTEAGEQPVLAWAPVDGAAAYHVVERGMSSKRDAPVPATRLPGAATPANKRKRRVRNPNLFNIADKVR